MTIINSYGSIKKTCISKKLRLFVSNIPGNKTDNWQEYMSKLMIESNKIEKIKNGKCDNISKINRKDKLLILYNQFNDSKRKTINEKDVKNISNKLIHIFFDVGKKKLPFGNWKTCPFIIRSCEKDYVEYIIDLINFMNFNENIYGPQKEIVNVYNSDIFNERFELRFCFSKCKDDIKYLKEWGEKIDYFLQKEDDFYLFDYLCRHILNTSCEDIYEFEKIFSIVTTLLREEDSISSKAHVNSIIAKYFIKEENSIEKIKLLRQIRNKIAHADISALNNKLEKYAKLYMDDHVWYDYFEYNRENWIIGYLIGEIKTILKNILRLYFTDRTKIETIINCEE